ncbi:SMC-Scp complex subunit ScpB [uncultured Tissierella sp.]|jgi:segregation and condensation protein B|uniref:SMC-Scp complex subunit ScpB n=1 Tax=Tissierella sp. TaxID=41274 RepID=UPI00280473F5|nr:SMC-Scp complex subunit ScpB [uncultured Tissierella sp.]MDU5079997.1 SMC-Scp complex subunit ScpB [Bacillota bacterium]
MDIRELKSIIESLLFTWGDPLEIKDIASIVEVDEEELSKIIQEMIDEFDYNMRGIRIIKVNDTYQFGTRPENFEWIKKLSSPKIAKNLSNAALETLSIIAYRQPIIKSDIEAIRGVKCDKAIETLVERGLITELGRLDKVGRPILYGTTDVFLRCFGLENLESLPPLKDIIDDIDNMDNMKIDE